VAAAATEAAAFLLALAGAEVEATGAGAATTVAATTVAGSTALMADFLVAVVLAEEVLILVFSEEVFEDMERGY
jgi:hypothetical protein